MPFTREINRLVTGILLAFGLVILAAAYWAVIGPDTILTRQDNPRRVEAEAEIIRGDIVDRHGQLLVTSVRDADGRVTRRYVEPSTYSALGYFSLRYGVGGAEAAYNRLLRGDDLPKDFSAYVTHDLIHYPKSGVSVQLTLDLTIQKQLAEAMAEQRGAGVVLSVPSGEVLALVSQPTYDPNVLDTNWEELTADPGKPFFNRALQGLYQPGSTLQTALIAAALLTNYPMDTPIENATQPIEIGSTEAGCAVRLPSMALTLRQAYAFACPTPFAQLVKDLGAGTVEATFETFHLDTPPTLPGFVAEPENGRMPGTTGLRLQADNLLENALGQGQLTVTPLEMAVMAAAIVNDGNAPEPYTLLSTRPPDSETWTPTPDSHPSLPFVTANTARQLQDMMRLAVAEGAAQNAGRATIDIGGHAALAYSGNESQAWFVGFATLGGRQGVAVAIVLENSSDPGLASDIGGTVLALAHERKQNGS